MLITIHVNILNAARAVYFDVILYLFSYYIPLKTFRFNTARKLKKKKEIIACSCIVCINSIDLQVLYQTNTKFHTILIKLKISVTSNNTIIS